MALQQTSAESTLQNRGFFFQWTKLFVGWPVTFTRTSASCFCVLIGAGTAGSFFPSAPEIPARSIPETMNKFCCISRSCLLVPAFLLRAVLQDFALSKHCNEL